MLALSFWKGTNQSDRCWRGVIVCAASYMVCMSHATHGPKQLNYIWAYHPSPPPPSFLSYVTFSPLPPSTPSSIPINPAWGSEALQHRPKLGRDGVMHWAGVQLQHPVRQTLSPVWKWQAGCLSHDLCRCCRFIILQGGNDRGGGVSKESGVVGGAGVERWK